MAFRKETVGTCNFLEDRHLYKIMIRAKKINSTGKTGFYRDNSESAPDDICSFMGGIPIDNLMLLDQIWDREIGFLGRFCRLMGIRSMKKGPCLIVKPLSSVAASELSLRSAEILRNLNKNFSEPWIKAIKLESGL